MIWVILGAEASAYHERFFKTRAEDYGGDVRANLEVAQFTTASHYLKAQRVRGVLREELLEVLRRVDVIVTPTVPATAPKIGERVLEIGNRKVGVDALGSLTSLFNLAGLPAISLPCGFTAAGLPVGLQIAGRLFEEATVLRVAAAYEASTDWHLARPRGL